MPPHGADDVTSNLSYSCLSCPSCPRPPTDPPPTPIFCLFPLSFSSLNVVSLAPDIRTRYKSHIWNSHHSAKSFLSLGRHIVVVPCGLAPNHTHIQSWYKYTYIHENMKWESPMLASSPPRNSIFPRVGSASPILTLPLCVSRPDRWDRNRTCLPIVRSARECHQSPMNVIDV